MSSREEKSRDIQEQIESEKKREYIKKVTIVFFKVVFIIVIGFSIFYLYTKFVATNGLIIKETRLVSKKLPQSFNSTKIIHFSDLHYGSTIELEDVLKIVKLINVRRPDIVIFTGDLIDSNYYIKADELEKLIKALSKIDASINKYAISGDEDDDNYSTILKQSGFILLDNTSDLIYKDSNEPILITGFSSIKRKQDINSAFTTYQQNPNLYNIVIMHEADSVLEIPTDYAIDLILAGGSLNGQICITKNICLLKREGSTTYFKEYYNLGSKKLFISSGIGTNRPNFRFMARPSINFFRLATDD